MQFIDQDMGGFATIYCTWGTNKVFQANPFCIMEMLILAVSTTAQAYLSSFMLYDDGPGHYKYGWVATCVYFISLVEAK